jgi:hypothetical protein
MIGISVIASFALTFPHTTQTVEEEEEKQGH